MTPFHQSGLYAGVQVRYARVEARKTYFRKASAVMACAEFNATQDRNAAHYFDATWEQKRWGGKVLTIRSYWPHDETMRPPRASADAGHVAQPPRGWPRRSGGRSASTSARIAASSVVDGT